MGCEPPPTLEIYHNLLASRPISDNRQNRDENKQITAPLSHKTGNDQMTHLGNMNHQRTELGYIGDGALQQVIGLPSPTVVAIQRQGIMLGVSNHVCQDRK